MRKKYTKNMTFVIEKWELLYFRFVLDANPHLIEMSLHTYAT